MENSVRIKNLKQSAKKLRLVADLVRGKNVVKAKEVLLFSKKKGADFIIRAINSSIANLTANDDIHETDNFFVKTIYVDGAPPMKRWRPAARGRAVPRWKKSSHLTLVLSDEK